ncbi:hypothetical protein KDW_20620 [Dictyobacter vulcani]|uniref:Peptidoglycan binding-like domain-containing protein n=1 Tax=Dictyobacter vulcani TaxID=2607529 RepID=A0A5J4KNA7_9CHLR|nr:peptidoglycan-binding protein [Dictyobacter vulcani]GER87900.1 hypothetical protein KDW_20620 [Dictyobacter vulcani]
MNKQLLHRFGGFALLFLILSSVMLVMQPAIAQAASWPAYSRGSNGENVRSLQYMLRQHGYNIAADGDFGPNTESAVRSFQSSHGLGVDGVVGSQTWPRLIVNTQQGSKGNAVFALQRQLNAHGFSLSIDGDFGSHTGAAVRQYQSSHGLTVDGVAGPNTWLSLLGGGSNGGGGGGGSYNVSHSPTISAGFINQVLAYYGSPAQGTGQALYNYGVSYNIDPVYALAFFRIESSFGKTGVARVTKSLGNIRCASGYTCYQGFRKYSSWEAGYADYYSLIRNYYINRRGLTTVDQIVPVYAPASENNVSNYIHEVKKAVDTWRAGRIQV